MYLRTCDDNVMINEAFMYITEAECDYDYLEIKDGPSANFPLLDKLSGNEIPASIQSSQNQIWMR